MDDAALFGAADIMIWYVMLCYACDPMRCDAMRSDLMRCDAMRCDALRLRCDALWCILGAADARTRGDLYLRSTTFGERYINHSMAWHGVDSIACGRMIRRVFYAMLCYAMLCYRYVKRHFVLTADGLLLHMHRT
jgi:hypothetical protein